jgi:hypothetical protein
MKREPKGKKSDTKAQVAQDQATRDSIARSTELAKMALEWEDFPTFSSLAEAEAHADAKNDMYFEICYHLEGNLNLCIATMRDIYAKAVPSKRSKMQTGIVRGLVCPEGWPKHPQTLIATLLSCARFRHEETCHAYTVKEAMTAFVAEKEYSGTLHDCAYDRKSLEPWTPADAEKARNDLLRLCDWIESRLHFGTHNAWYRAPACFSDDPETTHLANIGVSQRHLAKFSERDRKRWEGIHERAAAKHQDDLKKWGTVGKVQFDPEPRTWTHPEVDARIIGLWPLVERYNWTYSDLLNVLEKLLPAPPASGDRVYPLDSEASLKVHCRTICGLTKSKRGKSAGKLPEGWPIAEKLFSLTGK